MKDEKQLAAILLFGSVLIFPLMFMFLTLVAIEILPTPP